MDNAVLDIIGRAIQFIGWAFIPLLFLPFFVLLFKKLTTFSCLLVQLIELFMTSLGEAIKWVMPSMVITVALSVFALSIYGISSIWWDELAIYLHALGICIGVAPTYLAGQHVKVDIVYERLNQKSRALVEFCGFYLLLMPVSLAVIWRSQSFISFAWQSLEGSTNGNGIQGIFVLKTALSTMFILLLAQGLSSALRATLILISHNPATASPQDQKSFMERIENNKKAEQTL